MRKSNLEKQTIQGNEILQVLSILREIGVENAFRKNILLRKARSQSEPLDINHMLAKRKDSENLLETKIEIIC